MGSMDASNKFRHFGSVPVINGTPYLGNIFYVNSEHALASDTTSNGTIDRPFATIDYAVGRTTANNNDCIVVGLTHAETISTAAGLALDVAGVSIEGLGAGNNRATITVGTDTAASIVVSAANVTVNNVRFVGAIANLATMISVTAAGFSIKNSNAYCSTATTGILKTIVTTADANDMTVDGLGFFLETSLATTAVTDVMAQCIELVGADRGIIRNCYFAGDFTTSAISGITTASKDLQIYNNRFHLTATEDIAGVIDLVAGCTGFIDGNRGYMAYATSLATIIDPASCGMGLNHFSNVVTEAGGLVGTAST